MLIEIHMIQNHSPSNLNRDDLGAPKTCLFGGVTRARISSQCLKRSIRNPGNPDDVHNRGPGVFAEAMQAHVAIRTKFFPYLVGEALGSSNIPSDEHDRIIDACTRIARKEEKEKSDGAGPSDETDSDKTESDDVESDDRPKLPQLVFLERSEAREFVAKLAEMRTSKVRPASYTDWIGGQLKKKALKKFLRELSQAYKRRSVDIALFGRMTTSDAFEDVEAAMQVAHAISTHAVVNEVDYFTAVDDLGKAGGGAGHVAEAMFNSACFYKYFCLDWDQLVRNLNGSGNVEQLAAATLGHFLRAAALTTPSGKQNGFAANNEPCGILVEIKKTKTPTSYANAFAEPVERIGKPDDDAPDEHSIEGRSVACLADHVQALRRAYGIDSALLWYSPKLWRFPLRYWTRSEDGNKGDAHLVTERRFDVLGGEHGSPKGLVEAVIDALGIGLEWADVKVSRRTAAPEA